MKGIITSGWVKLAVAILWVLPGSLQPLYGSDHKIVIVKSGNNSYFNQTIETLTSQVENAFSFKVIDADSIDANADLISSANRIIALGIKASQLVLERFPKKKLISAYLTQQQHGQLQLTNNNQQTVLLDQPLLRYLAFTKFQLDPKSIGIINHSPVELNQKQHKNLIRLKLQLKQYQSTESRELLGTVRQLVQQNDVLLMLPEQGIYNRHTLKGILLTAYRARRPVISYSPAHVKSGALASIYSSPTDIGRHIADILINYSDGFADISANVQFARYYSVMTNSRVARALGIDIPDESGLSQYLNEMIK